MNVAAPQHMHPSLPRTRVVPAGLEKMLRFKLKSKHTSKINNLEKYLSGILSR